MHIMKMIFRHLWTKYDTEREDNYELIPAVDHAKKLIRDAKDQPILYAENTGWTAQEELILDNCAD